jgi:aryl-alcohol dehydrogenase-like predicted oxidoreductase
VRKNPTCKFEKLKLTILSDLSDDLSFFSEHGVGLINASPVAMGLLTNGGAPDWHPSTAITKKACYGAGKYCHEKGFSLRKHSL